MSLLPNEQPDNCTSRATLDLLGLQAELACENCRRKKVRCDRVLPSCGGCVMGFQECSYPHRRGKPGPKIGSKKPERKRKRSPLPQHESQNNLDEHGQETVGSTSLRFGSSRHSDASRMSPTTQIDLSPNSSCADSRTESLTRAYSLQTVIRLTHELVSTPPPEDEEDFSLVSTAHISTPDVLHNACLSLGLSVEVLQELIQLYFDNMMTYSLFHQPTFSTKISNIKSEADLKALLAALCSYSSRFLPPHTTHDEHSVNTTQLSDTLSHARFHTLAVQFIDEAMHQCGDGTPSLCLLQAIILTTFNQLIGGVQGRAWRSLGLCVRVAYELNLHLVDSTINNDVSPKECTDLLNWCSDEEKRRSWWAIWEMDTVASIIKRTPTAIDWTKMRTCLPVSDAYWFKQEYHQSCFLHPNPIQRLKGLQKSDNENASAWIHVITSFIRDAQLHSNFDGRLHLDDSQKHSSNTQKNPQEPPIAQNSSDLKILVNILKCVAFAIPEPLKYHGELLSFASTNLHTLKQIRRTHYEKYTVYMTLQLAKFLVYNCYSFEETAAGETLNLGIDRVKDSQSKSTFHGTQNCLETADKILEIIEHSSEEHVRYVHPFIANTVSIAAKFQLVYRTFGPSDINQDLVESKFELLRHNYLQYVKFWNAPSNVAQNLESLEERLREGRILPFANKKIVLANGREHEISQRQNIHISTFDDASWLPTMELENGFYSDNNVSAGGSAQPCTSGGSESDLISKTLDGYSSAITQGSNSTFVSMAEPMFSTTNNLHSMHTESLPSLEEQTWCSLYASHDVRFPGAPDFSDYILGFLYNADAG